MQDDNKRLRKYHEVLVINFGEWLSDRLDTMHKSEAWLSHKLDINYNTVRGWIRGTHTPRLTTLYRLCAVCDVDFWDACAVLETDLESMQHVDD